MAVSRKQGYVLWNLQSLRGILLRSKVTIRSIHTMNKTKIEMYKEVLRNFSVEFDGA